jgi:hypothetical protein
MAVVRIPKMTDLGLRAKKCFDFRAPSFTLRPWKRTLSASDSRPTPGGPKATSYQSTKSHQCVIAADATGVASLHMKPINRSTASLSLRHRIPTWKRELNL